MDIPTAIVSAILGFLSNYLLKYFEPKPKFVIWLSHSYEFKIPVPNTDGKAVIIHVQTVRYDNLSKFPIADVEIVHKVRPDHFAFDPPQPYQESTLKDGEHLISLKSIAPQTGFSMQFFSHTSYPNLLYVRSKQGNAEVIQVKPQIINPQWKINIVRAFFIVGVTMVVYWLIHLISFLVSNYLSFK